MKNAKLYIAGHTGLLGTAIIRKLRQDGFSNILTIPRNKLDLTRQREVEGFFKKERPDYVILAAARVGGIHANMRDPALFLYDNLCIQVNVLHSAYQFGVKKLLFFGSACSYPRACPQPITEEYLLTGELEPTNQDYAVAKITGIKMCQSYRRQYAVNFISAVPANIYGPGDDFSAEDSHVIPALIRKFHDAKISRKSSVTIWGTGSPCRDFIYVDDVAEASLFLMQNYNEPDIINIGTNREVPIKKLAQAVKEATGFKGDIVFDVTKPDGMKRKVLAADKINKLGWKARVSLKDGIEYTYKWYLENKNNLKTKGSG